MSGVSIQLNSGSRSVVGRIFLSLFFLVFFGMGLLFTAFIVRQTCIDARTYSWPKAECVILESGVRDKGGNSPYEFQVHYRLKRRIPANRNPERYHANWPLGFGPCLNGLARWQTVWRAFLRGTEANRSCPGCAFCSNFWRGQNPGGGR
jgi:hypothetical protein